MHCLQGALKQGERPLIGVIGSPHGSPQIKAWPAVSPTTSCSDIEGKTLLHGAHARSCGMLLTSACPGHMPPVSDSSVLA
jgi:hypothetical protein